MSKFNICLKNVSFPVIST